MSLLNNSHESISKLNIIRSLKSQFILALITKKKLALPNSGAESAEEEEAVALGEGREEREDAVDGQSVEETLTASQFISQPAPHYGSQHHPHVHDQTCAAHTHAHTHIMQPCNVSM